MAEDPRRIMVGMVGRLSRETQLHLDERHQHFQTTDMVLIAMSLLLAILGVFNVYYISVLYQDLSGIVNTMDSMHGNLKDVEGSMTSITDTVITIDQHVRYMDKINGNTESLAEKMPRVSGSMNNITGEMTAINQDMGALGHGMINIEQRFGQMTGAVSSMSGNMNQISRPMSFMNPIMP